MLDTATLVNQEVLCTSPIDIAEGRDLAIFKKRSLNRNFDIAEKTIEEVVSRLTLEVRKVVLESLLKTLEISLTLIYIKTKIYELTEDAETLLATDELLISVVTEAVDKIEEIVSKTYPTHKVKIYLSKDMEVPKWNELVTSIIIDEENFDRMIETWDKIEKKIEEIIAKVKEEKGEDISHLEEIDNKLAIELERPENV